MKLWLAAADDLASGLTLATSLTKPSGLHVPPQRYYKTLNSGRRGECDTCNHDEKMVQQQCSTQDVLGSGCLLLPALPPMEHHTNDDASRLRVLGWRWRFQLLAVGRYMHHLKA